MNNQPTQSQAPKYKVGQLVCNKDSEFAVRITEIGIGNNLFDEVVFFYKLGQTSVWLTEAELTAKYYVFDTAGEEK